VAAEAHPPGIDGAFARTQHQLQPPDRSNQSGRKKQKNRRKQSSEPTSK
jgi:hypothetical protein